MKTLDFIGRMVGEFLETGSVKETVSEVASKARQATSERALSNEGAHFKVKVIDVECEVKSDGSKEKEGSQESEQAQSHTQARASQKEGE